MTRISLRVIRVWAAADRTILIEVAARCAVVDVVEHVEEICFELYGRNFTDGEVLLHRQVRIEKMRTEDAVPSYISDLVQTRLCKGG